MKLEPKQPKIFTICGPSGVGKDTVMKELEKFNLPLRRVITTTSRPMRIGESEGHPYHFVTKKKFQEMTAQDKFAEYAKVFNSHKGITKVELEKIIEGELGVLLQIEHQGAKTIKKKYPQSVVIVITPPSLESLEKRLRHRGDKQEEELKKRLEQNKYWKKDYGQFDYFVANPDNHPEKAAKEISEIIKKHLQLS